MSTVLALTLGLAWASALDAQDTTAAAATEPAPAPERSWSLDLGAEYSSRYLFRGVSLLGDEAVIDPHAHFGWGNFGVYYYGYLGDIPDTKDRYQENDFGADYTFAFGDKVSFTLGAVTYLYNNSAHDDIGFADTWEGYGIVSFDTFLTPTVSYYHDFDAIKGGYLSLGISHGFTLGPKVSLNLSGSAGFDFHYNNKDASQGTFNDILLGADLPIQFTDAFGMHVLVQQTISQSALDKNAAGDPALKDYYGDQTVLTVGLSYSF